MPVTYRRQDALRGTESERRIGEGLKKGWKPLGDSLVGWLRQNSPVYRQTYKKSHRQKVRGIGLNTALVVFSSDPLGKWKDHGRKPGKHPPPPAMLAYVKYKGMRLRGSTAPVKSQQQSLAFLIGQRLARRGTKNPPHLYDRVKSENLATINDAIRRLSDFAAAELNR